MKAIFILAAIQAALAIWQWLSVGRATRDCIGRFDLARTLCERAALEPLLFAVVLAVGAIVTLCIGLLAVKAGRIEEQNSALSLALDRLQDDVRKLGRQ